MFADKRNFIFEKEIANQLKNESYLEMRSELVSIIKMMIKKLKFSEQTFYQAVLLMDILLHKVREDLIDNFKIVAVSCLILSGIN